MFEIKQIINNWMKRISTPLGRIAIIKSLLISKLSYLLLTLPNPSDNVLSELTKYYLCLYGTKNQIGSKESQYVNLNDRYL